MHAAVTLVTHVFQSVRLVSHMAVVQAGEGVQFWSYRVGQHSTHTHTYAVKPLVNKGKPPSGAADCITHNTTQSSTNAATRIPRGQTLPQKT